MLHIFNRLKYIYIIFLILILTGCKAEYIVNMDNTNFIKEITEITEENKETFDKKNKSLYEVSPRNYLITDLKWPTPILEDTEINPYEPLRLNNIKYYTKNDISTFDKLGIRYSYNFKAFEYKKSNILNNCYNYNIKINNDEITFKTKDKFKCFNKYELLEEVTFILNTTCKMKNSNADKIENTKYIWNITKQNYKDIEFEIDCSKKENRKINSYEILIVIFIYIIILLLIYLVGNNKRKINNKI